MVKSYSDSRRFIGLLCSYFPDVPLFQVLQKNLAVDPLHITQIGNDEDFAVTSICVLAQSGKSCVVNFHPIIKHVTIYSNGLLLHESTFDDSAQYDRLKSSLESSLSFEKKGLSYFRARNLMLVPRPFQTRA